MKPSTMRARFQTFLSSLKWQDAVRIALALILMGIVLARTNLSELTALKDRLSWTWLALGFLLFMAMTLLKTVQYWALLGGRASYRRTLKIVIFQNALTNFVANSAGIAGYLTMFQADENVKVRQSGAVFLLTKAGDLLSMGFFLLVSSLFVWTRVGILHELVIIILSALALGLFSFWTILLLRQSVVGFLRRLTERFRLGRISLVERGLFALESLASQNLRSVLRASLVAAVLSLCYMLASMAYGYTRVQTFQIPLDFWGILFIASLMQLISIIPIQVFGGLGVTEVSLIYLYGLFGITDEIPAILVGLRVLFYLFNLILLAYVPLDMFLNRRKIDAETHP